MRPVRQQYGRHRGRARPLQRGQGGRLGTW
jgi:hypothetical protein